MRPRKIKVCYVVDSDCRRKRNENLQNVSKKLRRKQNFPNKCFAWKVLKTIVFVICMIFCFYQSTSFITDYYAYPTSTRFTVIHPKKFKMPSITFCNSNPFKRSTFCSEFPDLCEPPNNLTEFCSRHPHMCSKNITNLVIPKFGYYTSNFTEEVILASEKLCENKNMSQEAWKTCFWDMPIDSKFGRSIYNREMTVSFDPTSEGKCYSVNFRFHNNLPTQTWIVKNPDTRTQEYFRLNVDEDESFYPWIIPRVLLSIHSPFVQIKPFLEGEVLKINHIYLISVKLEEEHLLPHPYQTNCTDYEKLWRENNKTGPRSQEACRYQCLWNKYSQCREFGNNLRMAEFSEKICDLNSSRKSYLKECMKNCKRDCVILKYSYKILEMPSIERDYKTENSHSIHLTFFIDDPYVSVMSHIPFYGAGELFSHIGGLMGCWLGISVATFTGILESAFNAVTHLKSNYGRYL